MQEVQEAERRERVRPKRPVASWFDTRRDHLGSWAFALNRITGLGLTVYLFIHLGTLSLLARGESAWNDFVMLARSPLYLTLDVVLIFGLLFHGLNGIRVALVGMGIGVHQHRTLFWILSAIGLVLLLISAWLVFTL